LEIKKITGVSMKYKSGQLFWGFLFLTIGSLFLFDKNNIFIHIPENIWNYWPVLIVLWGISILTKGTFLKPIISAIAGIFFGLFLFGSIWGITPNLDSEEITDSEYTTSNFFEDYRNPTETATLSLRTGVGVISIEGTTDKLIDGTSSGFYNSFNFKTRYRDNNARIVLRHSKDDFEIFNDKQYRKLDVSLNPNPEWEIDLKVGAATVKLDFEKYKVSKLNLETGATTTDLKFGDRQDLIKANVEMGAATLHISIPETSGCLLKGDMVMVVKDLDGFEKIDKKRYKSYNFDNSKNKIYINLDGGVSTLKIDRY
jgi:hypothetical protein